MLLFISFLLALAGAGIAGAAALQPDTGIDGTLGAFLAFVGAGTVALALGLLLTASVPKWARGVLVGIAGLVAVLTSLAAWFLMQNTLLATMALTLLALLASSILPDRKIST